MEDEKAFHKVIDEDPYDPTPRLVYADWLDENGKPESAKDHRAFGTYLSEYGHSDPNLNHIIENPTQRKVFRNLATRHYFWDKYQDDDIPGLDQEYEGPKGSVLETGNSVNGVHSFEDNSSIVRDASDRNSTNASGTTIYHSHEEADLPLKHLEALNLVDSDTAEIARHIRHTWPGTTSESDAVEQANEWSHYIGLGYFGNHSPSDWMENGYWNPHVAAQAEDLGYSPDDTPEVDDEDFEGDPIYALCNNDVSFAPRREED